MELNEVESMYLEVDAEIFEMNARIDEEFEALDAYNSAQEMETIRLEELDRGDYS